MIKAVKEMNHLGFSQAKALVESVPKVVREGVSKEDADKLKAQLEAVGTTVELR